MRYKHQLVSQQRCLRRSSASTATPAHWQHRQQPSARKKAAGDPVLLPSTSSKASSRLGWPRLGHATKPRSTTCTINNLGRPGARRSLCRLTLWKASPACTGVPGASSDFSAVSLQASFSSWHWARACLRQEARPLWDTVTGEGCLNSLRRAAPWTPTGDYRGVGGNIPFMTSDLATHPLA